MMQTPVSNNIYSHCCFQSSHIRNHYAPQSGWLISSWIWEVIYFSRLWPSVRSKFHYFVRFWSETRKDDSLSAGRAFYCQTAKDLLFTRLPFSSFTLPSNHYFILFQWFYNRYWKKKHKKNKFVWIKMQKGTGRTFNRLIRLKP